MIRMLRTLALAALALVPLFAAATPAVRGVDPAGIGETGWPAGPPATLDRADAYADIALADQPLLDPVHLLAAFSLVTVTEPPIAALLATAVIWLLAINWRFRRERKRRELERRRRELERRRRKHRTEKRAVPGA